MREFAGDMHLVALCSIPYLGPVTIRRLVKAFGSPERVMRAPMDRLATVSGVSDKRASAVAEFREYDALERNIGKLESSGGRLVFHGTEGYPEALYDLGPDAPILLYVRGGLVDEDRFAMAVIGARDATDYGRRVTESIAAKLGGMGITIVSGLARGIDTCAHRAAIKSGGRSIGVLGSGLDVPYPPENKGLMDRMAGSGAVLSEFPPGTRPLKENFPRRNRLISALSLGVLVVEAARKSGSLITARFALEQGKEVFAIPGNVGENTSTGANELIRQGAHMATSAEDIVAELAPVLRGFIKKSRTERVEITPQEKALCDIMSGEPLHVDALSRQSGMPVARALGLLLTLELKGVVKQVEGKRFYLT